MNAQAKQKKPQGDATQPVVRWLFGIGWMLFLALLVYEAHHGNSVALWSLVGLSTLGLIVTIGTCDPANPKERSTLPAWIMFPLDVVLSSTCVCLGGWIAFAGVMFILTATTELVSYGDISVSS